MSIKHIVFDLHGTLTDSDKSLLCTKRGKLMAFGERRWMTSDVPEHTFFEEYCRSEPISAGKLLESWREMEASITFFPGIPELLKELKADGLGIHLLSNTGQNMREFIKREQEVFSLFDTITLSFEEGCVKPDPRIYEAALSKIGAPADECVMVGDNERCDIDGARHAGMHAILFKGRIESVQALKDRIAELRSQSF